MSDTAPSDAAAQRARATLNGLRLSGRFDIAETVAAATERIGEPIRLCGVPHMPPGIDGLWIRTSTPENLIVHDRAESKERLAVVVAHELGHIVLRHTPDPVLGGMIRSWPNPTDERVASTIARGRGAIPHHRASYGSVEEIEAEVFARLAVTGGRRARHRDPVIDRLLATF
ncbi:ImmA/IrrE family metallo-endopeptidase [Millisia brevis]|uniref:ImmA/IrrE family metallo-endopeptidase n=1 Tax=Millisia brevis TaxID=264148 RepID=UPI0012ECD103|nr:ImmA/IrrE family metallo-endopeptidase [Millisia brevis]